MSLIVRAIKELIDAAKNDEQPGAKEFRECDEEDVIYYHHALGRALRNGKIACQSLWEDNDLTKEFRDIGIWHADDMSWVLIIGAHRIINGRPVKLEEIRSRFHAHWRQFNIDPWTGEEINDDHSKTREVVYGSDND